jgi:hypothetical protein
MAVHLYTGRRVTTDVNVVFSKRVFVPPDLIVDVDLEDGSRKPLHFHWISNFALLHQDYSRDALAVDLREGQITIRVLTPVDLAVSKVARLSEVDRQDIQELVAAGLTTASEIESRARQARAAYVGGLSLLDGNLDQAIAIARQARPPKGV